MTSRFNWPIKVCHVYYDVTINWPIKVHSTNEWKDRLFLIHVIINCKLIIFTIGTVGAKTRSTVDPQRRILDNETRRRRQQRQLDALEKDNHHDDPHAAFAHLLNKAKLPSFSDGTESMYYMIMMHHL